MHAPLLASTLTIAVGGLVAFVEGQKPGDVTLLLLRNQTMFHHHLNAMDGHQPHLVVKTADACLKPTETCGGFTSHGANVIGIIGEQLVRYPLSDAVRLTGFKPVSSAPDGDWPSKMVMLPASLCPYAGHAKPENGLMKDWPTAARVELHGVKKVTPSGYERDLTFVGSDCPGGKTVTRTAHEYWNVEIELESRAGFSWDNGDRQAPLDTDGDVSVSIWNLPEETESHDTAPGHTHEHMLAEHFSAYYSLLTNKNGCDCKLLPDPSPSPGPMPKATAAAQHADSGSTHITSTGPVFCPPAGIGP